MQLVTRFQVSWNGIVIGLHVPVAQFTMDDDPGCVRSIAQLELIWRRESPLESGCEITLRVLGLANAGMYRQTQRALGLMYDRKHQD